METKPPIINCHTHVFTGDHVPPYLAKTFVPFPLHFLFSVSLVVKLFRFWYNHPYRWQFQPWFKKLRETVYWIRMFGSRSGITRMLISLIGIVLAIQVFCILYDWVVDIGVPQSGFGLLLSKLRGRLLSHLPITIPKSVIGKLSVVAILFLFFKAARNFVFFLLKKVWSFLGIFPGAQTKKLAARYLNIGRFAFYKYQTDVFSRLKNQYPEGTGFIVLPMDMEYMDAGSLKPDFSYAKQMEELKTIKSRADNKNVFFPFIFAEPRRIKEEGATHLAYSFEKGKIILKDCFIKEYIEDNQFSGFKIYPALGYYPFDETLLPLWKYAADNGLPILTHCIRGTIYYRGNKKKEWDKHPIFEQADGEDCYGPLMLLESKNIDFINNFTHPLNYLCLLDERLLRKVVQQAKNDEIRKVFGYQNPETKLEHNLSHLKLCFGHFGGDDEWNRFIESDRDNYSSQLVRHPSKGISFMENESGEISRGKPEQIWKYVDWYSIICSMMLQYPNVYADLSYIIHNPDIQPLLNQTMQNEKLKERVLFGTDFYVVRNHKSEKNMLADIMDYLTEKEFDQIARLNPKEFLANGLH